MAKTPTWQRKAGQNPSGGLNEAGRRSLKAAGHDIKRPQPEGGSRRDSFCRRMKGMKAKNTSSETANDPDSRINKSLRAWNCADGGPIWDKDRPKRLGKPEKLTPSEKKSAKASAKAAGRPYPNLVDNMRAARADGGSVRPELGAGGDALKAALQIAQKINSAKTSVNQIPGLFKSKVLETLPNHRNLDIGGGKYDTGTEFLKSRGIESHVYDPFNRAAEHNEAVMGRFRESPADSVTVANVLNVIQEPEARAAVIKQAMDALRPGGKAYFSVYEGNKSGLGTETPKGWQENRRVKEYLDEIKQQFPEAQRKGKIVYGSRPEMGAGGDVFKAAMKAAEDVIRAYHGSPHKFDKFDISKIGTGEGAQAYGHGLYFAGNENVAKSYREALSPYGRGDRPEDVAARVLHATGGDREAALAELRNRINTSLAHGGSYEGAQNLMAARNVVNTNPEVAGHMYEVGIRAKPEQLLDWDAPIVKQSPAIQEFARSIKPSDPNTRSGSLVRRFQEGNEQPHYPLTGSQLLVNLERERNSPQASNMLKEAGIPGIKYLDQVSRGAGEGSSNYVVFDPKIIDIMRRYATGGSVEHGLRIAKELGGDLEGDVSYLDTPEFEDSGSIMAKLAPNRPQKDPSDFIKQELAYGKPQLPQYDREAEQAWKDTGVGAVHMGSYMTPLGPYVQAYDAYNAAKDIAQNPKDPMAWGMGALTAAFPTGGRAAKKLMAAGLGAGAAMAPTDAEAGLLTPKMFRDLYQYALAHPKHSDPILQSEALKSITSMQTPLTGKIAQPGHIYNLSHATAPLDVTARIGKIRGVNLLTPNQRSWTDLFNEGRGGAFIGLGGDRSRLGRMTEVNGQKMGWPVDWHAGPEYMLEPNPGSVWANAEGATSTLNNQILRASRNGTRPVYGAYMPMGSQSMDSSVQMIDSILSLMHGRGKLDPKVAEEFDNMVKKGGFYDKNQTPLIDKAKSKFEDWPGINNPKEAADFIKKRAREKDESLRITGTDRGALVKAIDMGSWNKKGFPNVGEIRVAGTDPSVLAAPNNMVGHRIVQLDPDQAARSLEAASKKKFGHNTYTSDLHGGYWGDVELAPRDLAMPNSAIEILNKRKVAMQNPYGPDKPRVLGQRDPQTQLFPGAMDKSKAFRIDHPMSPDFRGRQAFRKVSEQARMQPITQRWLDSLLEGQQRLLKEGYKRGGKVEDALRLAHKILSKG